MKDNCKYGIYSDAFYITVDYASNKKDAIKRAKELKPVWGEMTVYIGLGDIVYETRTSK